MQARSSSHFQVFFLKLVKNTSQQLNWVLSSSSVGEIQSSTVYILKPRALASLSSHFVVTTTEFSTCIQFIPKNLRQQLIKMTVNQLLWTKQQQFCKRSVAASWVKTCSSPFSAFISSAAITFWGNICSPLWENPPFPELFFSCLHQLSAALVWASPPHRVPPFRPFSFASLNLSVTACISPGIGFSWQTAQRWVFPRQEFFCLVMTPGEFLSWLCAFTIVSEDLLMTSPHPNLCLSWGIQTRG